MSGGTCPTSCVWLAHPDNAAWQRCGDATCQIERPKPEGNAA
jgi:hypothetical protein